MASVRFTDVQSRPTEFLDFTSVTLEEFQARVPPFEAAFHTHMAAWRLDGKPRTARQFSVYQHCPLPTPEDRRFFLRTYLKTYALQVVQGRLFGMGQSKAHQWIHVLLPALLAALRKPRHDRLCWSWLRVFKSGDAMRIGHGGRQAQQTEAILPEKRGGRRGSMWDGRYVIAGCFTRMLRRCAGRTNVRFLHILQEIRVIDKTRNQLSCIPAAFGVYVLEW
jgi:hypothetical protein